MRILITTPVFPPELGGPATFVPHFAAYLRERGHAVSVLTYTDEPSAVGAYAFRVSLVRRGFFPLRIASFFVECLRLARQSDVVFVCEHPALPSVLAAKIRRRPVVLRFMVNSAWELSYRFGLTPDGPDRFLTADGNLMIRSIKSIEAATLRRADLVVAVSHHLGETAARLGVPRDRIVVSYNLPPPPASAPMQRPAARASLGIAADTFLLLVVARLVNWKGVDTVISALAELPPRFRLVVVGEGPMEARLRALSERLGIGERVAFAGRADREAVERHLTGADLLVLNSLYEGLSHVLLEAMRSGVPILASDTPGTRELIQQGDNGYLFPYNDRDALAQGIALLARDADLLRRFRERSRQRLAEIRALHGFDRLERAVAQVARS